MRAGVFLARDNESKTFENERPIAGVPSALLCPERPSEREGERDRDRRRIKDREREIVHVCVRERERERERGK